LDGSRRDYDGRYEHRKHERLLLFSGHRCTEQDGENVRHAHHQHGGRYEVERPDNRVGFWLGLIRHAADQIGPAGEFGELDRVTRGGYDQRAAVRQQIVVLIQQ